jgi:hypothetical protein
LKYNKTKAMSFYLKDHVVFARNVEQCGLLPQNVDQQELLGRLHVGLDGGEEVLAPNLDLAQLVLLFRLTLGPEN